MEEKINIAEILENKSQGTKLYSLTYGDCFYQEYTGDFGIECQNQNGVQFNLDEYGRYCIEGECILFPSKEMRDWEKFSWKKGDILVNSSGFKLFFDRWANDDYTRFFGNVNILEDSFIYETEKYTLVSKDETLDNFGIENPEFNDGDIVFVGSYMLGINTSSMIAIFRKEKEIDKYKFIPALCESNEHDTYLREDPVVLSTSEIMIFRPATDSEKQQLFDALEKEGKAWDSDKKAIVNLKPKVDELKPFDKVLVRDGKDEIWEPSFFFRYLSQFSGYNYQTVGGEWRVYCIPYNEDTKHLLCTKTEWKGGEG